jgi:hypothetical protein
MKQSESRIHVLRRAIVKTTIFFIENVFPNFEDRGIDNVGGAVVYSTNIMIEIKQRP